MLWSTDLVRVFIFYYKPRNKKKKKGGEKTMDTGGTEWVDI